MATVSKHADEALERAQGRLFSKNDEIAIIEFAMRGINPADITPRFNVLTFHAWQACGRRVAKGAISVEVLTWIPIKGKKGESAPIESEDASKGDRRGMRPKSAYLFHISQTVAIDAAKGTRPDAWDNPLLVKAGTYENELAAA